VQLFSIQERNGPVRNSEGVCIRGAQKLTSKQRHGPFSVRYVESRTEVTFESIGLFFNKFIYNMLRYRVILYVLVYTLLHIVLSIAVW